LTFDVIGLDGPQKLSYEDIIFVLEDVDAESDVVLTRTTDRDTETVEVREHVQRSPYRPSRGLSAPLAPQVREETRQEVDPLTGDVVEITSRSETVQGLGPALKEAVEAGPISRETSIERNTSGSEMRGGGPRVGREESPSDACERELSGESTVSRTSEAGGVLLDRLDVKVYTRELLIRQAPREVCLSGQVQRGLRSGRVKAVSEKHVRHILSTHPSPQGDGSAPSSRVSSGQPPALRVPREPGLDRSVSCAAVCP
jgi:hypothetical protein